MLDYLFRFYLLKTKLMKGWIENGMVKEISNKNQRIQIFSPQNVWVHSSFFQDILERNEEGGAILMRTNSNHTCLLIEESYFLNCTSTRLGGSIFQTPGNLILHSICCSCYGKESYPDASFVYSLSTNSNDHFQEIEYCSVKSNVNADYAHIHYGPIILRNGCMSINSLNLSQEIYIDAMVLFPLLPYSSYSYNSVQYSSFVNNTQQGGRLFESLIYFETYMNCYMCNILRNNANSIFSIRNQLTVKNSCILENNCNQLVYLGSSSYYAYFYNCTCQNATSNYQTKIRTYSIPSSSFLHALDCFQTGYCVADYDYLDDLDPYIPNDENNLNLETLSHKRLRRKKLFL